MHWRQNIGVAALWLVGSALVSVPAAAADSPAPRLSFKEGNQAAGLRSFTVVSGTPQKDYIIEAMGGGVCLLDYDRDGFIDIYFVNGGHVKNFQDGTPSGLHNALFHNQGDRAFRNVTEAAGVGGNGAWGYGCSAADYDNDGWPDLYVANYGHNILYHNLGNGRFEEVTAKAKADDPRWSTGSAWADYNGDGWLDLFVGNYIALDPAHLPPPGSTEYGSMGGGAGCVDEGMPVMCGPAGLPGAGDSLLRNNGDGTFTSAGKEAGVDDANEYYALGAEWCDFDDDNRPDLYVANDGKPNYLYHNLGDGTFEEMGLLSGVAVSGQGDEQASMGVACGDYENKGLQAIYVTHFASDTNALYRNEGHMNFVDMTFPAGLGPPTLPGVNWGTFFFDADNDGWLDLFAAGGHVYPGASSGPGKRGYRQANLLFHNTGGGHFQEAEGIFAGVTDAVSRGAVWGDLDNDGALDIVVSNLDDPPSLLWNETQPRGNFLMLTLQGTASNRDAVGAHVRVRTGSQWQLREVRRGDSYLSGNDPRVHFGLGTAAAADEVQIRWPSGVVTVLKDVRANQFLTVVEPKPESKEATGAVPRSQRQATSNH
jgi:hypothetical protein